MGVLLTCPSAWAFTSRLYHSAGNGFLDRISLSFDRLCLEINLFGILLLTFLTFLILLRWRIVAQHRALFSTFDDCFTVDRFLLFFQSRKLAVNHRIMLQGHWPFLSVLDVDLLLLHAADPLGELKVVGHGGGEHND